jgi:hypothetical protein
MIEVLRLHMVTSQEIYQLTFVSLVNHKRIVMHKLAPCRSYTQPMAPLPQLLVACFESDNAYSHAVSDARIES